MKEDIQILLDYLRKYVDTFNHAEIILESEQEDSEMITKIKEIAKKRKLKF